MQEEAEHKMVLVVEGVAKLTPRLLTKAMKQALRFGKGTVKLGWKGSQLPAKLYKHNLNKERHGKMTVKQLSRQNRGGVMSQIEIEAAGIGKFIPIAKKYGIDFAIRKIPLLPTEGTLAAESAPEVGKYNYQIFFKGADRDTVERAFAEYIAKYDPMKKKSHERNEQETTKPERSLPAKDTQPQKQTQKQSKEKKQAKKRTKSRTREKRPSLLKRLEQKKREVEDQRREIQRAPQELSR